MDRLQLLKRLEGAWDALKDRAGEFETNLQTVLDGLRMAEERGVELMSFPESFLTGYFRREEDARANALAMDSPQMKKVLEMVQAVAQTDAGGSTPQRRLVRRSRNGIRARWTALLHRRSAKLADRVERLDWR